MNLGSAQQSPAGMFRTESPQHDLEAIIRSRTPIIAVESNEEPQIVALIRQIARRLQLKAFRWTITEGLQAFEPADQPLPSVINHPSSSILSAPRGGIRWWCCWISIRFWRTQCWCGI